MAQFVNSRETVVAEAVNAIVAASGGKLARLDGFPHIRVVLRNDWDKQKVALVSGGGSGHEPAHAGYVGEGMLTAAVCGDVFASPSVDAVLAGILAVTGDAGCLLIVKNYTGDRLNFGLAAERARERGLMVEMVIVDDDIALPGLPQARGLAGTLLVHKIAGAMAENGADLATVADAARRVIARTHSIGVSLGTSTVPGSASQDRIPEGMIELGLGIHGEPGVEQVDFSGAGPVVETMIARLAAVIDNGPHVVLVNNLGGTSMLEMSVIVDELRRSRLGEHISGIIGPASMMTSLDMHGFSITAFPADQQEMALLRQPAPLAAWPGVSTLGKVSVRPLPEGLAPVELPPSSDEPARRVLAECCSILIAAEADLNVLDAQSGDGDTGSTLAGAARALLATLDRLPLADPAQLYRAIGRQLAQTMGGSSGVLLAIFFSAAGEAAAQGAPRQQAFKAGLRRVQDVGGAKLGDRTMVDSLAPALDALDEGLIQAAHAARAGADRTAGMTKANAGRATYVNARQLAGHVDPGAEAVARLFEQLAAWSMAAAR
jgi:dihydroxyacetone kinase